MQFWEKRCAISKALLSEQRLQREYISCVRPL